MQDTVPGRESDIEHHAVTMFSPISSSALGALGFSAPPSAQCLSPCPGPESQSPRVPESQEEALSADGAH